MLRSAYYVCDKSLLESPLIFIKILLIYFEKKNKLKIIPNKSFSFSIIILKYPKQKHLFPGLFPIALGYTLLHAPFFNFLLTRREYVKSRLSLNWVQSL